VNGWHIAAVLALTLFSATGVVEAHELTPQQLGTITFDQRPGQRVPPDIRFRDENGQAVMLGDYLGQRPLILTLNYFHCQNLCPLELDGLMNGLNGVSFTLGQDFDIVSVSIDPREGPSEATAIKLRELRGYDQPQNASNWHVLTGLKRRSTVWRSRSASTTPTIQTRTNTPIRWAWSCSPRMATSAVICMALTSRQTIYAWR